ncbi:tripartite tricarboxylate transporter TctB family protein [Bradyrhizobium sp. LHD-71]|uniref:tripartite tricarboxylate transporter TctB family protein n=1 Tax=Bradyrhizobium sp. LHD-71 TaxID=3072141 RepID=UPI00280F516E|nr:tripartite tricarboxylate transporter TctB family protein [Bradyrhizobium sp. LHD-71]MDQ8726224.1 tripartite tricarboxylate transporter TctB family protein [Bradyrhizobium sp. LHD-71]
MLIRNQRAFAAGVLFLIVSIFYFVMSFNYVTGTPARMGPGFFPRMVSIGLALIAVGILLSAVAPKAKIEKLEKWDVKGLLWIAGSVALFAVLLPTFGLVFALAALVIVASLASPEFTWPGALVNTVVLVIFCVAVFIYGINLQFPVWPVWFR